MVKSIYDLNINEQYLRTEQSKFDDREKDPIEGKCNNFNDRKNGGKPTWIMEHHTVSDLSGSINIFLNKSVSTHYMIAKDGEVYHFVADDKRAYHAGNGEVKYGSKMNNKLVEENILKGGRGIGDINSWSIGIEHVNTGFEPYTKEQVLAGLYLHEKLIIEHNMNPRNLITHAEWSLGRKIDPSPYFYWKELAEASKNDGIEHNFGVYPDTTNYKSDPDVVLSYNKKASLEAISHVQEQLEELGYPILEANNANLGVYDQKTRDAAFAFTIRYMNNTIIDDSAKLAFWNQCDEGLSCDVACSELAAWTENHELAMIDVLGQYNDS